MKTSTIIKQLLTAVSIIALTSASVYAHSNHDHSNIPIKWNFSQNAQAKLIQYLTSNSKSSAIGLSKLDQETLRDYGINVGNKFSVMIDNASLKVERTTLGIKILTANKNLNDNFLKEIPIRDMNMISKVSMASHSGHNHKVLNKAWTFAPKTAATYESIPVNKQNQIVPVSFIEKSHAGHDHSQFSYEWVFTAKVRQKVERNILNEDPITLIGLSSFYLKKMDHYGIKEGMTFMTTVHYSHLLAKRTSSGFQIVDVVSPVQVANLSTDNNEDKL